jgi:hypothetical protein
VSELDADVQADSARTVRALTAQVSQLRTLFLEQRQANLITFGALTERIEELEERVTTVHRAALRAATVLINPKGAA